MKSLLPLFVVVFILGCRQLNNDFDEVAVECSVPSRSQSHYLKIYLPNAQTIQGEGVKRLQASFLNEKGIRKNLPLTANGCIEVPQEAGLLNVVDRTAVQSLTQKISPKNFPRPGITIVTLQTLSDFALNLNCPIEGLYADDALLSPETLGINGDLNGLEFRLDLYSSRNQFFRRIFEKRLGENTLNTNSIIDVGDLPEGSYELKLFGRHIANGIDVAPSLLNAEKACAVHIIHGEVKIKGFEKSKTSIVAKGASLSWKPEKAGGKLYICKEARQACLPKSCQNPDNFALVDELLAEEVGVFDYHVFVKDQLGRKSQTSCQTIIVSDSRPLLSVEWEAEDLKLPGSVLRVPYANLKAQVQMDHSLVDKAILKNNLECKVNFEIKGRDLLSGNSVFCTQGRCQGKPMGQFVPCDENIGLSLIEAWEQPLVATSRLVLSVRISDGAGHVVEAETSLWINKSVWTTEILDFEKNGIIYSVEAIVMTKSGIPVAVFADYPNNLKIAARYVHGQWEPYSIFRNLNFFHFHTKPDGTHSVLASYRDHTDERRDEYFDLDNEGLIKNRKDISVNFSGSCASFSVEKSGRLWCSSREADSFMFFEDGSWRTLPSAKSWLDPNDETIFQMRWLVASDGRIWVLGRNFVLVHHQGQGWRRLNFDSIIGNSQFEMINEDHRGRMWLTTIDKESWFADRLFLLEKEQLKAYPSPYQLNGRLLFRDVQRSGIRQLQIGFQTFDFSNDSWSRLDLGIELSEDLGVAVAASRDDGTPVIALPNHGFVEQTSELIYWPIKALGFSCECKVTVHNTGKELYFITEGQTNRIIKLNVAKSSHFDGNMLTYQGRYAIDSWFDSKGSAIFAMENGSILKFNGDSIQKSPVSLPKAPIRVAPLPGDRYCVSTIHKLSIVDQDSKVLTAYEGEKPEYYFNCSEDAQGRIWFSSESVGYVDSDKVFHPLFKVMDESAGFVHSMIMVQNGQKIWTASSKLIRIITTGNGAIQELNVEDLFPDIGITEISTAGQISDDEISFHGTDIKGSHYNFIYNLRTGNVVEDVSLMQLDPQYRVERSKFRGDTAWAYSFGSDEKFALLTRKNGQWSKVTLDVLNPWARLSGPAIQWAPDFAGRIWFLSNAPHYEFYRYDP